MLTFQDFESYKDGVASFVGKAIQEHLGSEEYKTAVVADLYDRQKNKTINEYVKTIFTLTGASVEDFTANNAKIASNFFHRLNTQRCTYSLGNGLSFTRTEEGVDDNGVPVAKDLTKEMLGPKFDTDIYKAGYLALIHKVSFCFWNVDRLYVFPLTNFKPLWDEETGELRAGIRFWQLDGDKPMMAVLYEEDGFTKFKSDNGTFKEKSPKRGYKVNREVDSYGEESVVGEENYGRLPIIPFWGSRLHQSTLVGMQQGIDSFDLIRSGFANDLTDCSQIYWMIENCGGMSDEDLARVRDRMKLNHMIPVDSENGGKITPYAQEIPHEARKTYLQHIREGIYEDFGGLDVHTVAAGATNDHIDAAYQPMDENADDFEYQCIECVQQILAIAGVEDTPIFKRNRISNQKEQVEMVIMEAPYLDDETILNKLPNISPDEVQQIMANRDAQDRGRFEDDAPPDEEGENTDEEEVEEE